MHCLFAYVVHSHSVTLENHARNQMRKLIILWNPCSVGLNVSSPKIGVLNLVVYLVQLCTLWDWRNQVENPFIVIVTKRRGLNTSILPAGTLVRATLLSSRVAKWNCKKYVAQLVREVAATNSAVNKKSLSLNFWSHWNHFSFIFSSPLPLHELVTFIKVNQQTFFLKMVSIWPAVTASYCICAPNELYLFFHILIVFTMVLAVILPLMLLRS